MKTFSVSLVLAAGIAMSSAAFAQIPVTDGASIAQQVAAQVETIAKWKMQYDQMTSQINQMRQCNFLSVNIPRRCHRDVEIRHAS